MSHSGDITRGPTSPPPSVEVGLSANYVHARYDAVLAYADEKSNFSEKGLEG